MAKTNNSSDRNVVNFLFEAGILAKTPRSFTSFLGTGSQSVAEHLNRATLIGYALASLESNIDMLKVLKMCLFHDFAEARISDLNYVHQKYVEVKEEEAITDFVRELPFGADIQNALNEYKERKTRESIIAKDADNLEYILTLKQEFDAGNTRAERWIISALARLKAENAQRIGKTIFETDSNDWWDKKDGPASQTNKIKHNNNLGYIALKKKK